MNLLHYF